MRRLIFIIFPVFLFQLSFSKTVDFSRASKVAINFYYRNVVPDGQENISISSHFLIRKNEAEVFYIFNWKDGKGFVIVSAEDRAIPVIGYSTEGEWRDENQPPALADWISEKASEIDQIRKLDLQPDSTIVKAWEALQNAPGVKIDRSVAPLLTSKWAQNYPYNYFCPADPAVPQGYNGHVPVGCVATAMAQILYYWRHPFHGTGYHCASSQDYGDQCAHFDTTSYVFTGMTDRETQEAYPAALLSWHAGISVDMGYGPTASLAFVSAIPAGLINYFKYSSLAIWVSKSSYSNSGWENLLKSDLDQGQPLIYGGDDNINGHAWVCDGYQNNNYFHFNWGWGGDFDGYFYLNNLNPNGNNFNNHQQAVVHIKPDPFLYPQGCSGQQAITKFSTGSVEDGSGPVASYYNDSDCHWLIAPDDSISAVKLDIKRLNLASSDYLTVYDGPNTSAPVLSQMSGNNLPPAPVVSSGPRMLLKFTSNSSVTKNGFMATFETIPIDFCSLNQTLTASEGELTDGSGRFMYRNNQICSWKIFPAGAVAVTLVFDSIDTEWIKDYIEIYDYSTAQLLGTFSGKNLPPAMTSGSKMMVNFKTNATTRGKGFHAHYTTIVAT
ncbi:MAG: C10 family peptidase, partial [Syntrophothermus sp.]